MATNDSQRYHNNVLKQQELQIIREKENLLYGSRHENNVNKVYTSSGAG